MSEIETNITDEGKMQIYTNDDVIEVILIDLYEYWIEYQLSKS